MNEPEIEKIISPNSVFGQIESFAGKFAVIVLDDGQKINWPTEQLPPDIQISQKIKLRLLNRDAEDEEREKLAKNILNEILK